MAKYVIEENGITLCFEKDNYIRLSSYGEKERPFISIQPFSFHQVHLCGDDRNVHHGNKLYNAKES